jgi:CRAL/TRIO domain
VCIFREHAHKHTCPLARVRAAQVRTAVATITAFANNYPERLGAIILLDPPLSFKVLWNGVNTFVDPVTRGKIMFVRGAEELEAVLPRILDGDIMAWLRETLARGGDAAPGVTLTRPPTAPVIPM